ncbi:Inner membrane ABC transporter permease protein YcjP [archaeon HR06]|nr:Inner membrane ABC transporter permease protein YcjP [archaeon HR06]
MKFKKLLRRIFLYTIVIITVSLVIWPILWMISFSFKSPEEQFRVPPTLTIEKFTLYNFERGIKHAVPRFLFNSFLVSSLTAIIVIIFSIFSAYSLTRFNFRWRKQILYIIILTQAFPLAAIIIPLYRIMFDLKLLDTYMSLIIAYLTFTVPTGVWLLRGFLQSIPLELEEAALIDGCNRLNAFIRIVLPLMRPGITTTIAYIFIVTWQEFMFALTFISSPELKTLPVGVLVFIGQLGLVEWGALMAGSMLAFLPVFALFLFLQKQLIAGLTAGALKA